MFQAPPYCSQGDCPLSTSLTNSEDALLQGNYLNLTYMLENLNIIHDLHILFWMVIDLCTEIGLYMFVLLFIFKEELF